MPSPQPSSIRVGRRYRANRLDGPYDVLVIGSGIGGLCAAACLSKLGKKVAVFEQHYTAGGFTPQLRTQRLRVGRGRPLHRRHGRPPHPQPPAVRPHHRRQAAVGAHGRLLRPHFPR